MGTGFCSLYQGSLYWVLSVIISYFLLLQNQNKPFHQSKTNHFQNRCMNLPEISNHFLKTMNRSILGNNSQNNFHCKNNHFHCESKIIFLQIVNHFHMNQFFLNNNIFHHSNNNNNSIHINRFVKTPSACKWISAIGKGKIYDNQLLLR